MSSVPSRQTGQAAPQPRGLEAWAARFDLAALPVLEATSSQIEALRLAEDDVDARLLSEVIENDPLMSLKVMGQVAMLRRGRDGAEPETLIGALLMLGIGPFFKFFPAQATMEDRLAARPDALDGLRRVMKRSHRAARFAMGFAVHRMDHDAAMIHQAALLHDFAELLLWLDCPGLALEIAARQGRDPALRSAAIQKEILGIELGALQQHLMVRWRLPSLLVRLTGMPASPELPQATIVRLAVRVARHSTKDWNDAALPDDVAQIGALLQLAPGHVQRLLREIDAD